MAYLGKLFTSLYDRRSLHENLHMRHFLPLNLIDFPSAGNEAGIYTTACLHEHVTILCDLTT